MLNEEKVRYMTELAIFEKKRGKEIFSINRYFKSDYVGIQMFRSFFGYTFSYLLILLYGPSIGWRIFWEAFLLRGQPGWEHSAAFGICWGWPSIWGFPA